MRDCVVLIEHGLIECRYGRAIAVNLEKGPIKAHREGALIELKVHPGSSRRAVEEIPTGRISIYVHAHPEKGKANQETLKVLSEALGVPVSHLEIARGQKTRDKTILAKGISAVEVRTRLLKE